MLVTKLMREDKMNHIIIKDYWSESFVEIDLLRDTPEGYQLDGGLVEIEKLRRYIRQNSPAFVYWNGRVYRREK